ncbi:unnamed protein product [Effrenium voratum]|nr:unnamed protein product [Effrenium voratum]
MAAGRKAPANRAPRASAGVPRDEALQRLQEAFAVLKQTQQGRGHGLEDCAHAVAADGLMRHPSSDVRLWAAKCLAEVLRIFVPSPPLERDRMRPVLELFLEQLACLKDPNSPSYTDAFGLLERVTEVRCFMLAFDCPEPEALIAVLVTTCLAVCRGAKAHTSVHGRLENTLAPLLINVLGEADEIPRPALEALLEELTADRKASAAGLVRRVLGGLACRSAALPINDFMNKALFADGADMSQERLEGLLCAAYELFAIEPALVARVVPNLQADLQCASPDRRRAVTALVGQLLAHRHKGEDSLQLASIAGLVDRYRERLGDADDGVRMTALEGTSAIMQSAITTSEEHESDTLPSSASAAESLREKVADRCLDPNDAIRLRAVEVITDVALASEAGLALTLPVLPDACRRILDKKPRVREACAEAAAQLYAKHALPKWTGGKGQAAQKLNWIPQLMCEAYFAFCNARLGYVAQLEELVEQHFLGCGAGLSAEERALAMLGFYSSASQGPEASKHGLGVLLSKKRDAHEVLRSFIQARGAKGSPLAEQDAGALALVLHQPAGAPERPQHARLFDQMLRLSPTMDDKYARSESVLAHIHALDAVRDKSLWAQLEKLLDPMIQESTTSLSSLLQELDRLLRVHRLGELAPLVRRALLSTWLLPDQVAVLLDSWSSKSSEIAPLAAQSAGLAKFFPGAFMAFLKELAKQLPDASAEDAKVLLRIMAACAKGTDRLGPCDPPLEADNLSQTLLEALHLVGDTLAMRASFSRKVAKILLLLPGDCRSTVSAELLKWTKGAADESGKALALELAAAILEQHKCRPEAFPRTDNSSWLAEARRILCSQNSGNEAMSEVQCAAADLMATTGSAEDVADVLLAPVAATESLAITDTAQGLAEAPEAKPWFDPLPVHAACAAVRAVRLGCVQISTRLLAHLAARFGASLSHGRPMSEAEQLLQALQGLQKSKLRPAERLRLCTALPAIFALAPLKRHRDAAQRMLQGALRAALQGAHMELLDFSVACFVHFLSRLEIFKREAAAKASAFPESSKVSAFFCEALMRCDAPHASELLGVALRVCDRVRYFVDREESPGATPCIALAGSCGTWRRSGALSSAFKALRCCKGRLVGACQHSSLPCGCRKPEAGSRSRLLAHPLSKMLLASLNHRRRPRRWAW